MNPLDDLSVERQTFFQFITSADYTIPNFQRPFAWTSLEAEELVDDIDQAMQDTAGSYFIGNVIYFPEASGGKRCVVDGQQRLATLSLVLVSARNWIESELSQSGKSVLDTEFQVADGSTRKIDWIRSRIKNVLAIDGDKQWRLHLRDQDKERLFWILDGKTGARKFGQGNPSIYRVASYLGDELPRRFKTLPRMGEMISYLLDNVILTSTQTKNLLAAYTIFSTVNARGVDISLSDLVRAEFLHRCEGLHGNSDLILDNLGPLSELRYDDQPGLVRRYWIAFTGEKKSSVKVREELVLKIEKSTNAKALRDLSEEIGGFAAAKALVDHFSERADIPPAETRLAWFNTSGFQQHFPVIYAAYAQPRRPKPKDLDSFLDVTERIHVLTNVVRSGNPSELEDFFASAARSAYQGKSLSDIGKALKRDFSAILPPEFKKPANVADAFAAVDVGGAAAFVLRRLEASRYRARGEVLLLPPKKLQVEHILPQRPKLVDWDPTWQDEARLSEFVGRLGNLTLLDGDLNRAGLNTSFPRKRKAVYSKSDIKLTKEIYHNYHSWGSNEIEQRSLALSKEAAALWTWND
jgi:hypothetical protein